MCREYVRVPQKLTKKNTAKWNLTFLEPTGLEDGSILQSPTRGEEKTNINLKEVKKISVKKKQEITMKIKYRATGHAYKCQ